MSESHRVLGEARGEPLPAGQVGVRVRVRLSGGSPSPRWSHALRARLANELTGRPAVGHLRLNEMVQRNEIVLDGVEDPEAANLGAALRRAVKGTNHALEKWDRRIKPNVTRDRADAIAYQFAIDLARRSQAAHGWSQRRSGWGGPRLLLIPTEAAARRDRAALSQRRSPSS